MRTLRLTDYLAQALQGASWRQRSMCATIPTLFASTTIGAIAPMRYAALFFYALARIFAVTEAALARPLRFDGVLSLSFNGTKESLLARPALKSVFTL